MSSYDVKSSKGFKSSPSLGVCNPCEEVSSGVMTLGMGSGGGGGGGTAAASEVEVG